MTKAFLQYLADQTANWQAAAMMLWEDGIIDLPGNADLRGRVLAFKGLQGLTHEHIARFYAEANGDQEDDTSA